eukprot:CRZ11022.1 hypothetical protein [Spongospora subterranea]
MMKKTLSSSSFHFSYTLDLTHSLQRISDLPPNSNLIDNAEQSFFWNHHLLADYSSFFSSPCLLVLVSGFFSCTQIRVQNVDFQYALFSRRSCRNAGTRFTRRGLDHNGDAVNFAEQEQIVCVAQPDGSHELCSFVQTRGSIPLLWSQLACLKWAPPVQIQIGPESTSLLEKHMSRHVQQYGSTVIVSLVNQTGKELAISNALSDAIPIFNPDSPQPYSLIAFDFHHKCKNMKYENIELLVKQVQRHLQDSSFFHGTLKADSSWLVHLRQDGCFRTNCMDCLDRTNVVQSVFASHALLWQLNRAKICAIDNVDQYPQITTVFRNVWADNANVMSVQYSGTNALKTDFTRTGKRSLIGAIQDGKNSIMRFYLNNFHDGHRQDSLDLFLGKYKLNGTRSPRSLPYATGRYSDGLPSLFNFVVTRSFFLLITTLMATLCLPSPLRPSMSSLTAVALVVCPLISLGLALRDGRCFVDKPKLLPLAGKVFMETDDKLDSEIAKNK